MKRCAYSGGGYAQFARIGLGVGNEIRKRMDGKVVVDNQHKRYAGNARDRHDAFCKVERKRRIKRCVDGVGRARQQQRIAVRWRTDDGLSTYAAARARLVLDDEWLAQPFRQPLA